MPVLLAAITGLTACDARCYDARHATCTCVCGGINHGRGLTRAAENSRRMKETRGQFALFAPAPDAVAAPVAPDFFSIPAAPAPEKAKEPAKTVPAFSLTGF